MMLPRRALFGGLIGLAAPAIIRTPGLLMEIKPTKDVSRNDIVPLFDEDHLIVRDYFTSSSFWHLEYSSDRLTWCPDAA